MDFIKKYSVVLAVGLVTFGIGLILGTQASTQAPTAHADPNASTVADQNIDLAPVWKAWDLLEDKFVPATTTAPLTTDDKIWGMIEGLAAAYGDPYTTFMPPREAHQFAEEISGSFGGVGIEIGMRDNILTIIAPLKGTPGDNAGLMSGDLIVKIDDMSTQGMHIDEAIERIRGEIGTDVILTIAREGETEFLDIPVTRAAIEIPTLDTEVRDDVFIISLYNFGGTAEREVREALREFLRSGKDKLIFDVRGNPGGYLESAVDISSFFLPLGKVVVSEDYGNTEGKVHRSKGYGVVDEDVAIVMLIDGGSASASEILAGALQAHDRAVLMGTQSFGKGSVQELIEVTPQTSLKITVARWLTPDGISISEDGLHPDFEVQISREDFEAEEDPQLDAAVAYLQFGTIPLPLPSATSTPDTLLEE